MVIYFSPSHCYGYLTATLCLTGLYTGIYIHLFQQTGDVEPIKQRHGPPKQLGDFEQLALLRIILQHTGIYESKSMFGVLVLLL